MKSYQKVLSILTILFFVVSLNADSKKLEILVTTFPIYQFTRNVTKNIPDVNVELLLPSNLGCPHDYTLVPRDMRKLAKANILIINGLGMEEFIGAPVKKANANIKIIDSSKGIENILPYSHYILKEKDSEHNKKGHHDTVNPHLFPSPKMAALIVKNIEKQLGQLDPKHSDKYKENSAEYIKKMNELADKFKAIAKKFKIKRIVTQHAAFDYLARDMGVKVVAVLQVHGVKSPSAAALIEIIKAIKDKHIGAIFTEPQYSPRLAETISKETGLPIASLDPVASGPDNAPIDYYQKEMEKNLKTLAKVLE